MPMPGVEELFGGLLGADGVPARCEDPNPPRRVRPSKEAQRLYRELARKAHPDLAQDDDEQERRERLHRPGQRGLRLRRRGRAARAGRGVGGRAGARARTLPSEAEVLYARLEWLAERKEKLPRWSPELEESAIGPMMRLAPDDPDALLDEIAEQLLAQVSQREARLAELVEEASDGS